MNGAESINRVIAYIVLSFVIIITLAMLMTRVDNLEDNYVTNVSTTFVNKCRTTGQINPTEYEKYAQSVYRLGYYNFEIEVEREVYYPDGVGGYRKDYIVINYGTILDTMYGDGSQDAVPYSLNAGDNIYVTATRTRNGIGTTLLNIVTNLDETGAIVCNYGGPVGSYE